MKWELRSRTDEKGLAGYVTSEATQPLSLKVNRFDVGVNRRQLIQVIYDALVEKQIHYALEEYDPSNHEQRIRTTAEILEASHKGTCLHNRWGIKSFLPATHGTEITAVNKGYCCQYMHGFIYQYNHSPSDQESSS